MTNNKKILDVLVCLSLANLVMMKVWVLLLPFNPGKSFWLSHSPANSYMASIINTFIIGLGFWCTVFIAKRWRLATKSVWSFLYVITLCFFLNGLRIYFSATLPSLYVLLSKAGVLLVSIVLLVLMAVFVLFTILCRNLILRLCIRLPLVFAPFIIVTFGTSLFALHNSEPEFVFFASSKHSLPQEKRRSVPVVWVIFDELDYGIVFEQRPKNLLLTELDKLRSTCVFVNNAYSPSASTAVSIPAMLTGKALKETKPISATEMSLIKPNGTTSNLKSESVFTDMNNKGEITALFGWYFPYSRVFNSVDVIKDYPTMFYPTSERLDITVIAQLRSLVEAAHFSPFGDSLVAINHILITKSMHNDVLDFLQTYHTGLIFLHYPIPHEPYIYDRYTHKYGTNHSVKEGYFDNVALVDMLLGEIRRTLEKTGVWDKSLFIVSADHGWRNNSFGGIIDKQRVPLMIKLPEQKTAILASDHFETVKTRQMISNVIDGKINTPEELRRWMQGLRI